MTPSCTIVTGSAGRVGRALRAVWGDRVAGLPAVWSVRRLRQPTDFAWDIGVSDPGPFPEGAVFLHLAGQTRGDRDALADNRRATEAMCRIAAKRSAVHIFVMSSGAVYGPSRGPSSEARHPQPFTDYGHAKLDAEVVAQSIIPPDQLTILRLGNLAGADALLSAARRGPVTLDPIEGQSAGPERSYIGPQVLAGVLEALIRRAATGAALPPVLNVAQPPALAMGDLLEAANAQWAFGPPRQATIPRVELSVDLLTSLIPLPPATAKSVTDDLASLAGVWP